MTDTWWCEHAWLGGDSVADGVLFSVSHGRITAIDTDTTAHPDSNRLRGLVIPGLANTHSHAFHRSLRARTQRDRGSFWTWRDLMYRAAERLNPDRYRRLARAVYAEMALAGITSVGEFHYVHHDSGGARYAEPNAMGHAVIDGAAGAGIRLTLLDACYLSSGPDGAPLAGPQQRFGDGTGDRWAQRVEALRQQVGTQPSVLVGAALHSVRGVPVEHMPAVVEWAATNGVPLHVHSSEQTRDLTAEDIADLDRTATGVCFCPPTERDLGDGIGPAPALLAGRGLFSLGSDSHAVIDLFEEARAVELNERLASRTRGVIAADRLLRAATYDGHRALGWAGAGELVVGARADFVAVQMDSIRTAGGGATVENVAFAAAAPDVTDVVVDGRAVVVDRNHVTVPDAEVELASAIADLMNISAEAAR